MAVNFWDQPKYEALKALCGYDFRKWEQTDMLKLLGRKLELERCLDTEADPFLITGLEKGVSTVSMP
ncbi:hypothetical protein NEMBOFW57_004026 [Staphylotrichum longicolle]|uniref:Uncharacterized protein n=1 Tax=Staphylotrichum longicolle TaxID=669026 RepID=A0AAD4F6W3_9PEZI|nr:hypothetical protein NEMBOFW57_004026 [Staphylotrichum longicolle]